jgi:hypothetical protein
MRRAENAIRAGLLAMALVLTSGAASAIPFQVSIGTTITGVTPLALSGVVPVGSSLAMDLFFDSATPNEVAGPAYQATSPGTLSSFLLIPVTGTVDQVTTDGVGTWNLVASMTLDLSGFGLGIVVLPLTGTVTGVGLTGGQILPDFASLTSGSFNVNTTPLGFGAGAIVGTIDSITLTSLPEPTALLLLAVASLGVARSRAAPRLA